MIDTILFDLDGVIVDTEQFHYESLIRAVKETCKDITDEEIVMVVKKDGTSTKQKLSNLKNTYKNKIIDIDKIDSLKQQMTLELFNVIPYDKSLVATLEKLQQTYNLGIVSNSRLENVETIIRTLNIAKFFKLIVTPENLQPKPAPDMYQYAIEYFKTNSVNTLILEDSDSGIQSAIASGSFVLVINNITETNFVNINNAINYATNNYYSNGRRGKQIFSSWF